MPSWIDISVPLSERTAPYPDDTPFAFQLTNAIRDGAICNVSAIRMSPHVGTHADAPYHYHEQGETMGEADLSLYMGPARVIDLTSVRGLIRVRDLQQQPLQGVTRLLVRTDSYLNPEQFDASYTALAPEAVDYIAQQGIRLVGIDTPSVDPASSTDLKAHQRFFAHDLRILETLFLAHVVAGDYELIALPLFLVGADASPVRAVLRPLYTGDK
ncbi:arylformamidase [Sulfoacidibacillus thermotolerans]|uniref:arylformamidase n=1 Tax=Sulfoacidibacillus thermotolerans TaxID=1765684 RepID=UPI001FE828E4|nr:arylformamidase [Sulfoacidibacillus thermotolerans]